MEAAGIYKFIFSSTAAVYGMPHYTPIDINHPTNPINPYGQSKLMVERILKDYDRAYGLKSIVLRYFNAAGADPKGRIGFHEPITHLIPQVLKAASGRKSCIEVYGTDYDTIDGTCVRDYIHVSDLISAHYLGARKLLMGADSATYNLGSGSGFSVRQIINAVEHVTTKKFVVCDNERRVGDPDNLEADNQEAMMCIG